MENTETDKDQPVRRNAGRIWVPLGLVFIGVAMFLRQLGLGIPEWIFSWPMLLIAVGIFSGLAHGFRGPGWLIMILIGSFFMMDQVIPGFDFHRFLWPAIIVIVGLIMLIRPKKAHWMNDDCAGWDPGRSYRRFGRHGRRRFGPDFGNPERNFGMGNEQDSRKFSSEDFIDSTTVFGGVHKNIVSKNFRGGDIVIFMGGAEINLSQADIQGVVRLDITQIMGGTKIIVPSHWEIRSDVTSVFGNIEDKRQNITTTDHSKVLHIDGSSVFGGIEIRSY